VYEANEHSRRHFSRDAARRRDMSASRHDDMIRLLNIFHLRLAMPRRFKPWPVFALLWMTGLSLGAAESTPPSLDRPTTATLARQLDTLDQIRLHYSALRYYSVADDDAGRHFDRLRT